MKVSKPLPIPTLDERNHSDALVEQIRSEINKQGGSLSFRKYMEMTLYEPGLGYYVAGKKKLGQEGDFVTAPEVSPLFSQCVASQCSQILNQLNPGSSENTENNTGEKQGRSQQRSILELGAGSGTMAADILLYLEKKGSLPEQYFIIDLSPDLKEQQKTTLENRAPHLLSRVQWLTSLPDSFTGVILGNEVLDAMPVELFQLDVKTPYQQHVAWKDEQFTLVNMPCDNSFKDYIAQLGINEFDTEFDNHQSYLSEFNPNINHWIEQLENTLKQGAILLIDYGYTRQEYYHPDRNTGTLICHYQHLVHNDFFWHPGLQDITANVDFTHVAEAADKQGLLVAGFTSQATFLAGCGLEEHFIQALELFPEKQYQLAQQIRTLSLPSEMGERFKVIALSKGLKEDEALIGFSVADHRHKL